MNEYLNKLGRNNIEYYSAIGMNKILIYTTVWKTHLGIVANKNSKFQIITYYVIPSI